MFYTLDCDSIWSDPMPLAKTCIRELEKLDIKEQLPLRQV